MNDIQLAVRLWRKLGDKSLFEMMLRDWQKVVLFLQSMDNGSFICPLNYLLLC